MNILKQAGGQGYRPIPLTRERVEAMGFMNNAGIFERYAVLIQPIAGESEWELVSETGETISRPFNSVHQLQNLYFALTNEELIFKL